LLVYPVRSAVVAFVAALVPARRASAVDPTTALRSELCLPIVEAQHGDWIRAGRGIVRRCQQAPGSGRDTKHAEVVATDDLRTGYVRSIVPHNAYWRSGDKTFEHRAVIFSKCESC